MRTGTRELLLGIGLLLVSAAASTAHAQCMACTGSTSCGASSARGGCSIECQGTICACADDRCGEKKPLPTTLIPTTYPGAGIRLAVADDAFVVVDCRGNFATMAYTAAKADELERTLDRVALHPTTRAPQVTARGPAAGERKSDE